MSNGESCSIWMDGVKMPQTSPLKENTHTDICIIGAGIAGLTTAYLLQKEGFSVTVLESNEIASGQSGRSTAHFSDALDDRLFNLEKIHGNKGLRLIIDSHKSAMKVVEKIIHDEDIHCKFKKVDGYLFAKGDDESILEKEWEAARKGGLMDVDFHAYSPAECIDTGRCLHFHNQMQLHPIQYLSALSKIIIDRGGLIHTNTHVTKVSGGENSYVETQNGSVVYCSSIVVATNTPINDLVAIHTKQSAYRTYVLGFKIPKGSFPDILLWDTLDPYHYIRIEHQIDKDVLIVGGEDHKTGQKKNPLECYDILEAWARSNLSNLGPVCYKWSGQVIEPIDGLAYLGRNPMDDDNVYIITGDSGNGMTHCTIGAMIITDLIMERPNSWEKLYSPSRFNLMATKEFIKENMNVASQYADWFEPKFGYELKNLKVGDGIVFKQNGKPIAAYKTQQGSVEYMSAVCPHMSGIVNWNSAESSWDCPCHGSRFDCHGKVIEGPANSDLTKLESDFKEHEEKKAS